VESPVHTAIRDTVIGHVHRDRLSGALAAMHRAGFGPHARVFDGSRGDLAGQLRRANLPLPADLGTEPEMVLLVVTAPGRVKLVTEMLFGAGAREVHSVTRQPAAMLHADDLLPASPAAGPIETVDQSDG